jgi:signal transduction histidine kinase
MQNSLVLIKPFLPSEAIKWFEICDTSTKFLLSLVQDTLDYALMQEGKFKLNFDTVDISQLMLEIVMIINVQMRLKINVILKHSILEGVKTIIESDGQRIR